MHVTGVEAKAVAGSAGAPKPPQDPANAFASLLQSVMIPDVGNLRLAPGLNLQRADSDRSREPSAQPALPERSSADGPGRGDDAGRAAERDDATDTGSGDTPRAQGNETRGAASTAAAVGLQGLPTSGNAAAAGTPTAEASGKPGAEGTTGQNGSAKGGSRTLATEVREEAAPLHSRPRAALAPASALASQSGTGDAVAPATAGGRGEGGNLLLQGAAARAAAGVGSAAAGQHGGNAGQGDGAPTGGGQQAQFAAALLAAQNNRPGFGGQPGAGQGAAGLGSFGQALAGQAEAAQTASSQTASSQTASSQTGTRGIGAETFAPHLSGSATPGNSTAASQTAAAPPPRPPIPPKVVSDQIAVQIKRAVGAGEDHVRIQLKPAELGRVDIRLEIGRDGRTQVTVTAERPDTLDLLQRDARGLQQALNDAGLRSDSGSLSFNLGSGAGHGFAGTLKEEGSQPGSGGTPSDGAVSEGPPPQGPALASDSLVDVRV